MAASLQCEYHHVKGGVLGGSSSDGKAVGTMGRFERTAFMDVDSSSESLSPPNVDDSPPAKRGLGAVKWCLRHFRLFLHQR